MISLCFSMVIRQLRRIHFQGLIGTMTIGTEVELCAEEKNNVLGR